MNYDISLDNGSYPPYGTLTGTIKWGFTTDNVPRNLTVALYWFTEGRGTETGETVDEISIESTPSGEQEFSFKLPAGPYSFSGRLIALKWAVEFSGEKPDFAVSREFVMSPDGEVIVLKEVHPPTGVMGKLRALEDRANQKELEKQQ